MTKTRDLTGLNPREQTDAVFLYARYGGGLRATITELINDAVIEGDGAAAKRYVQIEQHLAGD
jgi:hypothetical protein